MILVFIFDMKIYEQYWMCIYYFVMQNNPYLLHTITINPLILDIF